MPFQPAVNCAEAVINWSGPGGLYANVLNFKFATAYDQGDIDALALAVDEAVGGAMLGLVGTVVAYVNTTVRGLTTSVDLEGVSDTEAGSGGASGTSMPPNVAYCLSLRTGLTGRSARGRFYTVGVTSAHLSAADTVTEAYRDAWIAALESVGSQAGDDGWQWGVLSRQNNNVVLSTAVFREITAVIGVDLFLDSQRRRLRNRGT